MAMNDTPLSRHRHAAWRDLPWVPVAGLVAAFVLVAWAVSGSVLGYYLAADRTRAQATLQLTHQVLEGHLRRFQTVPDLLADDGDLRALLDAPGAADSRDAAAISAWLATRNALLDSSVIYVMGDDGITIASSNHDQPDSFVGQDFAFRPYFTAAIAGGRGRYFALGTTSGVRGYYFAAPVRNTAGAIAGVIAVKVDLDMIEADWRRQTDAIIVTDAEGVVFLSTQADWLYQGFLPLTADRVARTVQARRYADQPVGVLPVSRSQMQGLPVIAMTPGTAQRTYLEVSAPMPLADWTVHVLRDTSDARAQARLAVAAILLGLCIVAGLGIVWWQRRDRLAARLAAQDAAKVELERRVAERTADLARMNAQIRDEIAERRATEAALRRTQADLVQAGKLAALGQMSAALSHEINQPLAAARNYADSAAILMSRGDLDRAQANVGQIVMLIDRMAAIARHLRHVARKPDTPLKVLDLGAEVDGALALLANRLGDVTVIRDIAPRLPRVRAGSVRLQQVLSNVLANAVDALEDAPLRRIEIAAQHDGDFVLLTIRDHGPGVAGAIADRIFDPFFTTKRVGSGLGLGLSISYNILKDFGGDLRVGTHPAGGAVFTIALQAVATDRMAAE
ncbi:two-component system, NtrC family, C4-dicarboxylate transport sensor histidine kinase DctB [Loktanella fryxellensis]|uniref:C4-dicarboxylate transport sensor protein DctB n=1 Tax=Loktanella fryxellensis TaxID=245187 RepID=A0A1H8F156_9RHOB|nr:ATP-binding protein [Loktanella fryxellensis]SEN25360.1 two-component system, NtrC family, C4-dicarboxylate transport sensor histidine kinase DctB [Loktanella fryxellensis]